MLVVALYGRSESELDEARRWAHGVFPASADYRDYLDDGSSPAESPVLWALRSDVERGAVTHVVGAGIGALARDFEASEALVRALLLRSVEVVVPGAPPEAFAQRVESYRRRLQRGGGAPPGNQNRTGKGRTWTDEQREQVLRRRGEGGVSLRAIARETGLSLGAVNRICRLGPAADD
jgi:DNA invertase Pin-like site-specific DNA recombinase